MIRVIVKREIKEGESVIGFLRKLRMAALPQPGYVSGETLINTENRQIVTVISTWRTLDDWKNWEASKQRAKINEEIESHLCNSSQIETYELLSA